MNLICLMVFHGGERPLVSCFSVFVVSRPFKLGKKIDTSFLEAAEKPLDIPVIIGDIKGFYSIISKSVI